MKKQVATGILWLSAARLAFNVLGLVSTFLLARFLSPDDFGLVAIATSLLEIVAAITELSLSASLIHHAAPSDDHFHTAWTIGLLRGVLVGAAFAAAAPLVARAYGDPRLITVMGWMGLSIFLSGLTNPRTVTLTRKLVFWQEFAVVVAQRLLGVVVSITSAVLLRSYWALIAGLVATQLAGIVTSFVVAPYRPRLSLRHAKDLLSFSLWLSLGQIVNTLTWRLDHLLLGAKLGAAALGAYTVGDKFAGLPTRELMGPLQQTMFPALRTVVDEPTRLRSVYLRMQGLLSAVALPVGALFAARADLLVHLVLGPKWKDAVIVVQYLALVMASQTMASPVRALALATGQTQTLFRRDVATFIMRAPLIAAAVYWGELIHVLQIRALTGLLAIVINMTIVQRILGVTLWSQLRNNERSLMSTSVMIAAFAILDCRVVSDSLLGNLLQVSVAALFASSVYVVTHFAIWRFQGKPSGPETELVQVVHKLRLKLFPVLGS